ncbi:hypothetical protein F5Y07DRAFT_408408 [Xylaria sp. FL0933]|nr:hypothetical protein F5Y07DRAFT_408408 [Xylaria sp. FL0933]
MDADKEIQVLGVNPKKIVTKEQFDAKIAELRKDSPDHVLLPETPADDARLMEELLEIEKGTLPNFSCRFVKGAESCHKCGRHYSILDMAKTGLRFHSKQFLNDTIFGKHGGYVYNNVVQFHFCYDCGEKAVAAMAYWCPIYGCG